MQHTIIFIMILLGAALMVTNIARYVLFIRSTRDVLSSGRRTDEIWELTSLALLVFFLIGYLLVAVLGDPDLVTAGILFGGSTFVAIVLTLMFRLVRTVKENSLNIAETLIGVVDARDPNLNGHSRHVRNLTMLIYRHLPPQKRQKINPVSLEFAALMHDIGKLGIPEQILNKPAKLTEEEWAIMRDHPRLGTQILRPLGSFRQILPWIEYHHEWINGNGYYHIPGQEIPFEAKVIAIADVYSAITMRRSYKPSRTHAEALAMMKEEAGTHLDPGLVELLCQIPEEELKECIPESLDL